MTETSFGTVELLHYWRTLRQRRLVVFSCLAIVVAATLLYIGFTTPEYGTTTTLQIERQGPEILDFKDIIGVDPAAYIDFYQTQYKILQSRSILRLAAERLDLANRPEVVRRKSSPIKRAASWAKSWVQSPSAADDPLNPAIKLIEDELTVQPIRNSHLVKVSFVDSSPQLAADVANAVADAYQQFSLNARFSTTAQASEFLTKEVARIQSEIQELERKLQDYAAEKQIVAFNDNTKDISEKGLADLNDRYTDARGRLAAADARLKAVLGAPPGALQEVLTSPLILELKRQDAEAERRYSQLSERFKPDWPQLQEIAEEQRRARARLDVETEHIAGQVRGVAQADYNRVREEVLQLERQVELQKVEVQRVNRDAIDYASLRAEIDTRRKVLEDLVVRRSQTTSSEHLADTRASNIRVVDRAEVPRKPVRPRKLMALFLATLLGTLAGACMALLLDYLDNTVKTEQDIERIGGLAVLGHVPFFQPLRAVGTDGSPPKPDVGVDLASYTEPRSAFAEAFKNLRTSLLLASPDHPPRTIVVTSCEPGDGKSTVSLNLAIVLTQMGRRVLLVDADLRRPRLHKMLALPNASGLSTVLSGNARPDDVLQETPIPNLLAVTSGPIPPNPSELLGSTGLAAFVQRVQAEGRFDHVFFDSPPALQVTDGVLLAAQMDATVVVARGGKTARESLVQGVARLRQSRGRVIGAVLNAVSEGTGYYYYGKYRYYHSDGENPAPQRFGRRHAEGA